jgi:hypothetical protein
MNKHIKMKLTRLLTRMFFIPFMISVGILCLAVFLFKQEGYWKLCGLILAISPIAIISLQIIAIINALSDKVALKCSINKLIKLIDKKVITNILKFSAALGIIVFFGYMMKMMADEDERHQAIMISVDKWQKEEQKRVSFNSHNHIRDDLKKIYLSYLAGHPDDISVNFQFKNNLNPGQIQFAEDLDATFNYFSLDTVTQFDISKTTDEFEYKDYLTQISPNSKSIVSNEIKQSSNIYKKDIPVTIFSKTYDFYSKSFNFYSMSIDHNDMSILPRVCTISTINPRIINQKLILNDAEKESYHFAEDLGGDFGKYCYTPNGIERLSPRAPYTESSNNYNAQRNTPDDSTIIKVGPDLPPIYLDLSDLYILGEQVKKNGVYIPDETLARDISRNTESKYIDPLYSRSQILVHKINGMITVSFSPANDCKISQVCILNKDKQQLYPSYDVMHLCDMKKVMICKPTFSNFRIQNTPSLTQSHASLRSDNNSWEYPSLEDTRPLETVYSEFQPKP